MFRLRRPTEIAIAEFLDTAAKAPLSYSPTGISREPIAGYNHDRLREPVGRGADAFAVAKQALERWVAFPSGWVEVFPKDSPVVPRSTVAVLARHLGFYSLNGCRIIDRWDSQSTFGFSYGTLTSHVESGEERFEVSLGPDTETVWYEIRATSRPRAILARIGYPVSRRLQARFREDSIVALQRAVSAGVDDSGKLEAPPGDPQSRYAP